MIPKYIRMINLLLFISFAAENKTHMLSINKIKLIRSLRLKKYRDEHQLFVAEGSRLVTDLSSGFQCERLIITEKWKNSEHLFDACETIITDEKNFAKVSLQQEPQGMMGVFRMKQQVFPEQIEKKLYLALDDIQDPGNLGTIIRIADWFGIRDIFCSLKTADHYNPKVVQSCMGALARVNLHYLDLAVFLSELKDIPVYGAMLDGENIYKKELSEHGIIVMGNEGNGISPETAKQVTGKILIPCFPEGVQTSESLNVAIATAIICGEFRRRL